MSAAQSRFSVTADSRRLRRELGPTAWAALEDLAEQRSAWLAGHAETLTYRVELAAQVSARRAALGLNASLTPPTHLVELLGPAPADEQGRSTWAAIAGRVEAYREQWGVAPEELHQPPVDGVQYREWENVVRTAETFVSLRAPELERGIELGHGLSR